MKNLILSILVWLVALGLVSVSSQVHAQAAGGDQKSELKANQPDSRNVVRTAGESQADPRLSGQSSGDRIERTSEESSGKLHHNSPVSEEQMRQRREAIQNRRMEQEREPNQPGLLEQSQSKDPD